MEKDQEKTSLLLLLPSTSRVGDGAVNEDEVSASPAVAATSTTSEGEGAASASSNSSKEDKKKVFASEEQIRAVFSNNLVS